MITFRFNINCQEPKHLMSDIELVSGDVGACRLAVTFRDNGVLLPLSDKLLTLKAKRADGKVLTDCGTIEGDTAYVTLKNSMYAVPGELVLELALTDRACRYVTTKIITATVLEGVGEPQDKASDEVNVYVSLLAQLTDRLSRVGELQTKLDTDLSELVARPTYGGKISAYPAENPVAGSYYITQTEVADKGVLMGGLVSSMFALDGRDAISLAYDVLFTPAQSCLAPAKDGYPSEGRLAVYNTKGEFAGYVDYHPTLETMPMYLDLAKLGVENTSDYVEFYLGIYDSRSEFPAKLSICPGKRMVLYDGSQYITYPNGTELEQFKNSLGDVDEALSVILEMDAKLLGGDA